jgi:TonB family protein
MVIADTPPDQASLSHWFKPIALAICIEILGLAGLAQWLQVQSPFIASSHQIELLADAMDPTPVSPTPPKPQPASPSKPAVQTPAHHLPAQVATAERTDVPAEPTPKSVALPVAEAASALISPPVPSSKTPDHSEYMGKVKAAVQQAFVYPAAASALGLHGKVKVKFKLNHKTPANAQVLISSGFSMIDRAALASVMAARYPEPTADINLSQMEFELWIEYRPS